MRKKLFYIIVVIAVFFYSILLLGNNIEILSTNIEVGKKDAYSLRNPILSFKLKNNKLKTENIVYQIFWRFIGDGNNNGGYISSEELWGAVNRSFIKTTIPGFADIEESVKCELYDFFQTERPGVCIYRLSDKNISIKKREIKESKEWFEQIIKKAEENNRSIDEQIELDAVWLIKHNAINKIPKGNYEFMLVVVQEEELVNLPRSIVDLYYTDSLNQKINPFAYFKTGDIDALVSIKEYVIE